jgi:hypothetical protein
VSPKGVAGSTSAFDHEQEPADAGPLSQWRPAGRRTARRCLPGEWPAGTRCRRPGRGGPHLVLMAHSNHVRPGWVELAAASPAKRNSGCLWPDDEGGLGEHPRVERCVVSGDELNLDEVLAGAQLGELFVQAVAHGDQLVVDQQVDVALVGPDAGRGLADAILAPLRPRRTSGVGMCTVWPLWGIRMMSLAVEAGRAAGRWWPGRPPSRRSHRPIRRRRPGAARPARQGPGRRCCGGGVLGLWRPPVT